MLASTKLLPLIFVIVLVVIVLAIIILIIETNKIKIRQYLLKDHQLSPLQKECEGVKIVFFSDIHLGKLLKKKELSKKVSILKQLDGDIYIFGGDLIGHNISKYYSLEQIKEAFLPLKDKTCLAVYGNHEYKPEKDTPQDVKLEYFKAMDFIILKDNSYVYQKDGKGLEIYGMNDYIYHEPIIPNKQYDLLICHEADIIDKLDNQIMLSGHTHGGQIMIPLINLYYKPINGKKYFKGLYTVKNNQLLISNGLGYEFM